LQQGKNSDINYSMNRLAHIAGGSIVALFVSDIFLDTSDAASLPFVNPPSSYPLQVSGRTFLNKNPDSRPPPREPHQDHDGACYHGEMPPR
jgi:hypothetical protein